MSHTYTNLLYHIVFSTKARRPFIDDELKPRLHAYLGGIVRELNGTAVLVNGVTEHVHMLASLPPTIAVASAVRVIKANSSKWVHDEWPSRANFRWQTGYGAFSVSRSNLTKVEKYIADQERHHRRMTFQEEFLALLKKHGLEYDERYVWD